MVRFAWNPKRREASCCRVEVMKGGAGVFFLTPFLMSVMTKSPPSSSERICFACASFLISTFSPLKEARRAGNCFLEREVESLASMVQYSSCLKSRISFSRSTISLTTTDCTLPAERPGLTVFHKNGLSLYPTSRSRMRRVCWALTRLISMLRGAAMPFLMPVLVISLKVTRFFSSLSSPSMLERCQEMASPSRSGSVAR